MAVQCVTRIAPTTVITNDALSNPLPRNGRSASFSEVDMVSAGPCSIAPGFCPGNPPSTCHALRRCDAARPLACPPCVSRVVDERRVPSTRNRHHEGHDVFMRQRASRRLSLPKHCLSESYRLSRLRALTRMETVARAAASQARDCRGGGRSLRLSPTTHKREARSVHGFS